MTLINRELYLSKMIQHRDKSLIKVLTGMRRTGKSMLLQLYRDYLIKDGVTSNQIIYLNFESYRNRYLMDPANLYEFLKPSIESGRRFYYMFDEIQMVSEWESIVNSLRVDTESDITIAGSNAKLLSTEISTLLSGRFVEIPVYPLSFKEYLYFNDVLQLLNVERQIHFEAYLKYGGLPVLFEYQNKQDVFVDVLLGVYNTVIKNDVIGRNNVRDVYLLDRITRLLMDNISNEISSSKIVGILQNERVKTSHNTVLSYMKMLSDAYITYYPERFDIKGKQHLKTLPKIYVNDLGIRNALLGLRNIDMGYVLENLVYIELLRRGYGVNIGKVDDYEIDFVATSPTEKHYIQVAYSLASDDTKKRELRALNAVKNQYPKTILTMDSSVSRDYDGIRVMNVVDFLAGEIVL